MNYSLVCGLKGSLENGCDIRQQKPPWIEKSIIREKFQFQNHSQGKDCLKRKRLSWNKNFIFIHCAIGIITWNSKFLGLFFSWEGSFLGWGEQDPTCVSHVSAAFKLDTLSYRTRMTNRENANKIRIKTCFSSHFILTHYSFLRAFLSLFDIW